MATAESGSEDAPSPVNETVDEGTPLPVGVKLGSTRTVVTTGNGKGIDEYQAMSRLATYEDVLTGEERVLYGEEAESEYPDQVEPMIRDGVPNNYRTDLTAEFFNEFTRANEIPADSAVVYAIPTVDNEEGLENLERVIEQSRVGEALVRSYPATLCGAIPAIGSGLDALDEIFVSVNLGSTYLEASAYRHGEQLSSHATGSVTGNEIDRRIAAYVEDETDGAVEIDTRTARHYKENHADFDNYEPFTDTIPQPDGGPYEFTVERAVMDACGEYLDAVVNEFADGFLPKLANDYRRLFGRALSNPIVLSGGMACIPGIVDEFETRLTKKLQGDVDAIAPPQPERAAAQGAHRIAYRLVDREAY